MWGWPGLVLVSTTVPVHPGVTVPLAVQELLASHFKRNPHSNFESNTTTDELLQHYGVVEKEGRKVCGQLESSLKRRRSHGEASEEEGEEEEVVSLMSQARKEKKA